MPNKNPREFLDLLMVKPGLTACAAGPPELEAHGAVHVPRREDVF